MRVSQDVLMVLDRAVVDGPSLRLTGQLERPLYVATNKVLELAGGKWSRARQAHIFPDDAADAIEPVLLTGEITDAKKEFQAFYTPPEIADRVMTLAGIEPGMLVLEPSAGTGALANPALGLGAEVTCVEINPDLRIEVTCGVTWFCADFLDIRSAVHLGGPFDRVVMNPPFSRQQDARHVLHAAAMLKPGGRLVAIMSAGVMFRETQAYREVRQLAEHGGSIIHLPQGSFRLSGTDVNTCLVTVRG